MMKKNIQKNKFRPIRIYLDKNNKYFFLRNKKRIYLNLQDEKGKNKNIDKISQKQLVNIVINNQKAYRKIKRKKKKIADNIVFEKKIIPEMATVGISKLFPLQTQAYKGHYLTDKGELQLQGKVNQLFDDVKLIKDNQTKRLPTIALDDLAKYKLIRNYENAFSSYNNFIKPSTLRVEEINDDEKKDINEIELLNTKIEKTKETTGKIDEKDLKEFTDKVEVLKKKRGVKKGSTRGVYNTSKKRNIDFNPKPISKEQADEIFKTGKTGVTDAETETEDDFFANVSKPEDLPLEKGNGKNNKHDGLYDTEIKQILKKETNKFVPVIASNQIDSLSKFIKKPKGLFPFVMNTDVSTGPGIHWVGGVIDFDNAEILYYDPLADNPTKKTIDDLHSLIIKFEPEVAFKLKINKTKDQSDKSDNCGYFVTHFIMMMLRGAKFKDASLYSNVTDGEKLIQKYKTNIWKKSYI